MKIPRAADMFNTGGQEGIGVIWTLLMSKIGGWSAVQAAVAAVGGCSSAIANSSANPGQSRAGMQGGFGLALTDDKRLW